MNEDIVAELKKLNATMDSIDQSLIEISDILFDAAVVLRCAHDDNGAPCSKCGIT